ncbi:hypothetical protein ACYOEI_16685 [Singulisphaera rosea]
MLSGATKRFGLILAATCLLAGCSGTDSVLTRRTTVGALKSSVSHLEQENQKLRTQMATLESENREIEDRLVLEEDDNGMLKARLDDARHALSQNGGSLGEEGTSTANRDDGWGNSDSPKALPAARSTRKRRPSPFTKIPAPTAEGDDDASNPDDLLNLPRTHRRDDLGSQGMRDDDKWLPVAQGTSESSSAKKVR